MTLILNYCKRMMEQLIYLDDNCTDNVMKAHIAGMILAFKQIMLILEVIGGYDD